MSCNHCLGNWSSTSREKVHFTTLHSKRSSLRWELLISWFAVSLSNAVSLQLLEKVFRTREKTNLSERSRFRGVHSLRLCGRLCSNFQACIIGNVAFLRRPIWL